MLLYGVAFLASIIIGVWAGSKLVPNAGENKAIARWIRVFAAVGVTFAIMGASIIIIHATAKPFESKKWDDDKRYVSKDANSSLFPKEIMLQNKNDDFDSSTLEFNEKTVSTVTLSFTIAGVFLAALGVFWLGFLESNRLPSAREHDQKVQNDKIRSLLVYALSLLAKIDKELLNFKAGYSKEEKLYQEIKKLNLSESDKIEHKDERLEINLFALEKHCNDKKEVKQEFERQATLSYRYLFDRAVSSKSSLLEEVERVVALIDQIMLEKDFNLFDDSSNQNAQKVRMALIELVESYKSYTNTLKGIDSDSELGKSALETANIDYNKLLKKGDKSEADDIKNPVQYLKNLYLDAKGKDIFYERFVRQYSHTFIPEWTIKNHEILSYFDCYELSDMFILMDYVHLDVRRFFLAYFEKEFLKYIEKSKLYKKIEMGADNDLDFEIYLELFESTFDTIKSEKRSLSKLFGLYKTIYELEQILKPIDDKSNMACLR